MSLHHTVSAYFFFNDTATTEIYTLSLHDALPISSGGRVAGSAGETTQTRKYSDLRCAATSYASPPLFPGPARSEEHTSELQSHSDLVCRLLLEKKKKQKKQITQTSHLNRLVVCLQ